MMSSSDYDEPLGEPLGQYDQKPTVNSWCKRPEQSQTANHARGPAVALAFIFLTYLPFPKRLTTAERNNTTKKKKMSVASQNNPIITWFSWRGQLVCACVLPQFSCVATAAKKKKKLNKNRNAI